MGWLVSDNIKIGISGVDLFRYYRVYFMLLYYIILIFGEWGVCFELFVVLIFVY